MITLRSSTPRVTTLVLSRAPVNAINTQLCRDATSAIRQLDRDHGGGGHGLVLASASPSVFSAGLDLGEMHAQPRESVRAFWAALQDLYLALSTTRLATVAALRGAAPAGGTMLALGCDVRVAAGDAPKARMGLNEAKFGLVAPFWFAEPLADVVGRRQADRMLQLGEMLTFAEAKAVGLVDELVPAADVEATAVRRAEEWVKNGPPEARHASKMLTRGALAGKLEQARDADIAWFEERVFREETQRNLGVYLASLAKPKAAAAAT